MLEALLSDRTWRENTRASRQARLPERLQPGGAEEESEEAKVQRDPPLSRGSEDFCRKTEAKMLHRPERARSALAVWKEARRGPVSFLLVTFPYFSFCSVHGDRFLESVSFPSEHTLSLTQI